jgi:hypothetical protein
MKTGDQRNNWNFCITDKNSSFQIEPTEYKNHLTEGLQHEISNTGTKRSSNKLPERREGNDNTKDCDY